MTLAPTHEATPAPEALVTTNVDVTASAELLFWVDVETTGLTPNDAELLQVAAIITDLQGNELADPFEAVIYHANADELRASSIPLVQEMHDANGLWEKLSEGEDRAIVDEQLKTYLQVFAPNKRQARLAGNSVRLDLNFMEAFLPQTYSHLHYRSVDVTAVEYALQSWGFVKEDFPKRKTHDALDDIRESLAQYRWLQGEIAKLVG